jgi:hypothetical protein
VKAHEAAWSQSVPPSTLYKYDGQPLVIAMHHLPSFIWALIAPFQLLTVARRKFPRAHRYCGRVFAIAGLVTFAGILLILFRGLDFVAIAKSKQLSIDSLFGGPSNGLLAEIAVWLTLIYFAASLVIAVLHARGGRYLKHRRWIVRHVSAGIWVALQRMLGERKKLQHVLSGGERAPLTLAGKFTVFHDNALIAIIVCVVVGELYVRTRLADAPAAAVNVSVTAKKVQ